MSHSSHGTLTRSDLATAIGRRLPMLTQREAKRLLDTIVDEVRDELLTGETVRLHGFGNLVVREVAARVGRNPKTGAGIPVTAHKRVVFLPSPSLKKRVQDGDL
jgi:integration host factor subunit alpha